MASYLLVTQVVDLDAHPTEIEYDDDDVLPGGPVAAILARRVRAWVRVGERTFIVFSGRTNGSDKAVLYGYPEGTQDPREVDSWQE